MLLYIALITYASLYVAAMLGTDTTGEKIMLTAGTICGCVAAVCLYLAALGICEM